MKILWIEILIYIIIQNCINYNFNLSKFKLIETRFYPDLNRVKVEFNQISIGQKFQILINSNKNRLNL